MLPTVHFTFSLGIAFCLEYKHPRKYSAILALGLIGMSPDLDHILPMYHGAKVFHNTFFMVIMPMALVMLTHLIESSREGMSSKMQRFAMCITVVLISHMFLDLIAGSAIGLKFPTSADSFSMTPDVLLQASGMGTLMVTTDLLWFGILFIVLTGNVLQTKIYALFEDYTEDKLPEPASLHYVVQHPVKMTARMHASAFSTG